MGFKTLSHSESHSESETDSSIFAEINITPLTDIFLVLLIIFMVTSSVMAQMGVNVNLPQASQATAQSQPEGVIITLLSGGRMLVNQKEVEAGKYAELEKLLKAAFSHTSSRLVILEGDRQAFLGSAIEVMDHARKAGAASFAIATTEKT
jgi:biopolymer transport protein ExbD